MTGRLSNRTALVIGAARGIGEGIARRFVMEGAAVLIADTEVEAGEALASSLGASASFVATDVSREEDVGRAVQRRSKPSGGSTSSSRTPASIRGR